AEAPRCVLLPLHEGALRVPVGDILYAEAFSHTLELHTTSGIHSLKIGMNMLEELLGEGFFRCHRSYLANVGRIRQVTRTALRLEGGVELPLARQRYDAANRAFIDYPGGD
ncbi:MAG TPA: LytTR family DNA-binding domain-containing protein, partial [Clostridia bacterium]|nr:LytTR family DNA-binding domain-containing protein [Clostridia bacterium]